MRAAATAARSGSDPTSSRAGSGRPPVYGQGQSNSVERYRAPQHIDRVQRKRNTDDDDVKTAKKTPAPEESKEAKAQSENSSIVTIGSDHGQDHAGDRAEEDRPCEVGQVEVQQ